MLISTDYISSRAKLLDVKAEEHGRILPLLMRMRAYKR